MPKQVEMDQRIENIIGDPYGYGDVIDGDMYGVEIELEGKNVVKKSEDLMFYWNTHIDNSLRANKPGSSSIEYVFRRPLNMQDTGIALQRLFDHLQNPEVEVYPSYRTSIHVHINFLKDTVRTFVNFITLCIVFDELFVSQNGQTRIGNNFCLRARDAEGQIKELSNSIATTGSIVNINPHNRYSSVNFASILKFGTVEFRSLECTIDYDRIISWISVIQALKNSAKLYENPREIISKFSHNGPLDFMRYHLGYYYYKYAGVPNAQGMLRDGMRLAQDFAYCSDWKPKKLKPIMHPNNIQWNLNAVQAQVPPPPPIVDDVDAEF